ncbi:MAG: family 10 glycosylhydrolase [Sedimentisphaerales bacterium]|nr:family 10 glycosylhydrolase [Sedimentisphaerales bacterium]
MSARVVTVVIVTWALSSSVIGEELPPIPTTTYEVVDDLSYSQPTAQTLWEPMGRTESVSVADVGGRKALRMPCRFQGTRVDRASWDRRLSLDLAWRAGIQFLFYCPDATPVASFSIYLHSGEGWYRGSFDASSTTTWTPIQIHKKDMAVEGHPDGWAKADTLRISAWRGQDVDTEFYIAAIGLFGKGEEIAIVRNDSVADSAPGELEAVRQYTDVMAQSLDRAGLSSLIVSDADVTAKRLKSTKLVILPHNPKMSDTAVDGIAEFLTDGGKLLACYRLPRDLEPTAGIRNGGHVPQKYAGYFSSIRPSDNSLEGMPPVTGQSSWNINDMSPVEGRSHVAAWWYTDDGQSTGMPAVVVSDNCICLTHVLTPDDQANKLRLLLAMVGRLVPELWRDAASGAIGRVGRLGPYQDYDAAYRSIQELASSPSDALAALQSANKRRREGLALLSESQFSKAITAAEEAQQSMIRAYCLAQTPSTGEHRAFWCHSAFGVDGMDWDQAIKCLADNGFTAVLPNMLWGGVAFYRSDVLPVSDTVKERGDQIERCLAACKKYGVQCHIWKVNYNMGWATDKAFVAQRRAEGRTQVNYDGSSNDRWLCPSHPENQGLEIESMLEIARKYAVDGLHFDYIRYPDSEGCFCPGCRTRFEAAVGRKVNNWPAEVRSDDDLAAKWLDFRRQQITTVVAAVAERARQTRPGIKVSAAVFPNWSADRDSVGQDWRLWCRQGYLDFVCPMDYTASGSHFRHMIQQQLAWAGRVPCYPGIGLSTWSDPTDVCKLIEQIDLTRQSKTGGFTVFNYGRTEATHVLPLLGDGMTRKK